MKPGLNKLRSKLAKILIISLALIALLSGLITYLILNRKNIHQIENLGKQPVAYRSAQLPPHDFEKLVTEKNIDVVLNLRGESKMPDFVNEKAIADKLGIEYHAYGFSVYRTPDKERFLKILDLIDSVKQENKTLLIHCRAGADRTGLISTLFQHIVYGFPIEEAKKNSLSLRYGHIPKNDSLLEYLIADYKQYADQMSFRDWVINKYDRQAIIDYVESLE